jgi:hypothetical protein
MSAITIILASLSALGLPIPILAAVDDRKRQQRLVKLGAMSRESFVNREECGPSPWGRSLRRKSRPGASSSAKPALRADAPRDEAFTLGHTAVGDLKVAL